MIVRVGDLVMTRYDRRWAVVIKTWWIGPPYKEQAIEFMYDDGVTGTQPMNHIVRVSHGDR